MAEEQNAQVSEAQQAKEPAQTDNKPAKKKTPRSRTKIDPNAPLIHQRNPAKKGISVPGYNQTVEIQSLQAQKVMRRVFSRASNSLYRIDVILRIIGSEEDAEQVEKIITDEIQSTEEALFDACKRLEAVMESNGITETPTYDLVFNEEVRIISPHVARFVGLVRKLDEIIACIDALWLNGIIANKDRNSEVYLWQQRVISLGARIISIEKRARESALKHGKADEVNSQVPVTETAEAETEVEAEAETETETEAEAEG